MRKSVFLFILFFCTSAYSQNFTREAGIRGGLSSGFTFRQFLDDNLSYEGLLSFRQNGIQITLLRQVHEQTLTEYSENLFLAYGFGGHVGFNYSNYFKLFFLNEIIYSRPMLSPLIGVDGYAALEYRLDSFPITFGIDCKPFFELSTRQFFRLRLWDLGLSVKYRF